MVTLDSGIMIDSMSDSFVEGRARCALLMAVSKSSSSAVDGRRISRKMVDDSRGFDSLRFRSVAERFCVRLSMPGQLPRSSVFGARLRGDLRSAVCRPATSDCDTGRDGDRAIVSVALTITPSNVVP